MIVKAIYEGDNKPCYINIDYIVDFFPYKGDTVIGYTMDERAGYIIDKEVFENVCEEYNKPSGEGKI